MKLKITAVLDAEISNDELAIAVFRAALKIGNIEDIDDAGCDWFTDFHGNTYIAGANWQISWNPQVAALIDAHHALKGREFKSFKLSDADIAAAHAEAEAADL